jgi:imidazoleglycerol-phosphate dehydratase
MTAASNQRESRIERETGETKVTVELHLGGGEVSIATGVGFFDHMLELLGRHANLGLVVRAEGDLATGAHHTVEDTGIALGQALDAALGDRAGIRRYGHAVLPMDETLAECAIDVSGRPFCRFAADLPAVTMAGFETELAEEFFRAVAANANLTVHLATRYGSNTHHLIEACFKAFARALRVAVAIDPDEDGVPSTKGRLG